MLQPKVLNAQTNQIPRSYNFKLALAFGMSGAHLKRSKQCCDNTVVYRALRTVLRNFSELSLLWLPEQELKLLRERLNLRNHLAYVPGKFKT